MINWLPSIFLLVFSLSLGAQNASNPFELTPRLAEDDQEQTIVSTTDTTLVANPFEIQDRQNESDLTSTSTDESRNPFDLVVEAPKPAPIRVPSPREWRKDSLSSNNNVDKPLSNNKGALLSISVLVLTFASISLISFRSLYAKAYRALFNDNLLSLLYREREAGSLGSFIIAYMVFFLGGALFLCLLSQHFNWMNNTNLWQQFGLYLLALMAGFIGKHIILAILGYVFPVRKEVKRYSFTIMIFAIVLGLLLTFGSILLAYTPDNIHRLVIYGLLGIVGITYALRSLRGLFIANHFIFSNQFHFLSYICAVEIGPVLCLYKLVMGF